MVPKIQIGISHKALPLSLFLSQFLKLFSFSEIKIHSLFLRLTVSAF